MHWMILPLKRYFDFSGRSRRMEFWMFMVFTMLSFIPLTVLLLVGLPWDSFASNGSAEPEFGAIFFISIGLFFIWMLALLIPSIAVTVRRLHDRDLSGWWYLAYMVSALIPLVSMVTWIVFMVFMFMEGTKGPNRFGPDPKDPGQAGVFA